jgi:hypothetical protein
MCTIITLDPGFRWNLYTTSLIRLTTLYGPAHEECNLGDFPFMRVGRESHVVAHVVALSVGQSVVTSFHPVIGQLQVLAYIT